MNRNVILIHTSHSSLSSSERHMKWQNVTTDPSMEQAEHEAEPPWQTGRTYTLTVERSDLSLQKETLNSLILKMKTLQYFFGNYWPVGTA